MCHIGFRCLLVSTCVLFLAWSEYSHSKDLYVSSAGEDTVSYEDNNIANPWRSITKGVYDLRAGDTLHIRGGEYKQMYPMRVRSDYDNRTYGGDPSFTMNAESGTAELPVTITGYADEKVIIDLEGVNAFIHLDNRSHWVFENLRFINGQVVFYVGQNSPSTHNIFRNLYVKNKYGGDNTGAIVLLNANAENTIIENNLLIGPGINDEIHLNTSLIYLKQVRNAKILNNEVRNAPIGIYYKHETKSVGDGPVDIEIAYNFIADTSRDAMSLNTNDARIHNNVLGLNNNSIATSNANGDPGGDRNLFENNTFYSGGLALLGSTQDNDVTPGSQNNIVRNNIFYEAGVKVHYFLSPAPHKTEFGFNLFATDGATHSENLNAYSLAEWKAHSGTGIGSIVGRPIFVTGNVSPRLAVDYELTPNSPGYNADSNGIDMGANVTLVGPSTLIYNPQPNPPSNVRVEVIN